eukprot:TRINITY_DN3988_c0_g1_i4.p1 TRINITY_DN3988_c0_g1~~TRINITY_DN3988_c0_g1_i4.p1  ORF type:complete len:988 (+),score=223.98 TRINITY_DN3988_c0_g1_i4:125-2965(+)
MRLLSLLAALASATSSGDMVVPTTFDCSSLQYYWTTAVDGVAVCPTYGNEGTLYTTSNGGKSWQKETNTVGQCPPGTPGGNCFRELVPEDLEHGLLLTSSGGIIEWEHGSSRNAMSESKEVGKSALANFDKHKIKIHPRQKNRILIMESIFAAKGLTDDSCADYLMDAATPCPHIAHYSEDFGKTFSPLFDDDTKVYELDWGNDNDPQSFNDDYVYFIDRVTSKVPGSDEVEYSVWSRVMRYDMKTGKRKLILQDTELFLKFGVFTYYLVRGRIGLELYVSSTNGMRVAKTELPSYDPIEREVVIDYSTGNGVDQAVFLAAYHTPCEKESFVVPYATLYRSDQSGEYFEVAARGLRLNLGTSKPDIHSAAGISGIYLANIATDESAEFCNACETYLDCQRDCKFATHMSWENGKHNTWKQIHLAGDDEYCQNSENCFLHLHDSASDQAYIPELMSKDTTPGLMMGCGNTGGYLDIDGLSVNTYISRDAGETWRTVKTGAHIYNWLDYGGLIIMAKSGEPTKTFLVSWDMGTTWKEHIFTDDNDFYATDIVLPGNWAADHQSATFMIVGISYPDTAGDVTVTTSYFIDMTSHKNELRTCASVQEYLDHGSRDFIRFSPTQTGTCFLGWDVTYIQRAPGSECWNLALADDMEAAHDKVPCSCDIEEDYECAPGFSRKPRDLNVCESPDVSGPVWDIKTGVFLHEPDPHVPPECTGTYLRTKGYILVSHCDPAKEGGYDLKPVIANCPKGGGPSNGNNHADDHTGGQHTVEHCTPVVVARGGEGDVNSANRNNSGGGGSGHPFLVFLLVFTLFIVVSLIAINILAARGNSTAMGMKLFIDDYSSAASRKIQSVFTGARNTYGPVVLTAQSLSDDELGDHPDITPAAGVGVNLDGPSPPPIYDPEPAGGIEEEDFATFRQPDPPAQSQTQEATPPAASTEEPKDDDQLPF